MTRSHQQSQARKRWRQGVSARRSGFMPTVSSAFTAPATLLRLWRSILRRCPKAAAVNFSIVSMEIPGGCALGTTWTTADITLGGGTKAERNGWDEAAACVVARMAEDKEQLHA